MRSSGVVGLRVLTLGADVEVVDVLVEEGERGALLRLQGPAREHRVVESGRADDVPRRRRHTVAPQQHVRDVPVAETCRRVRAYVSVRHVFGQDEGQMARMLPSTAAVLSGSGMNVYLSVFEN